MENARNQRRKGGRVHAVSAPVRRQPHAALTPSRVSLNDPCEQLAYAYVYRPIAKAHEAAGTKPKHTTRSLRDWVTEARAELAKTPAGLEDMRRVNVVLANAGAELVALATRATVEMQDVAVDVAVIFVRIVRRYDLAEPEELEFAKAYAMNLAIAKAARARLFGVGFSALSATRVGTLDDGAKLTTRLPAGGDLAVIAREHDREARIALLTLRDLVRERGPNTHAPSPSATAERDAAIVAERERRAAHAAARAAAEPEPTHDDDQEHDDQDHPAEEQDAGHPLVGPSPTPPSLDALNRAPRAGQHAHRPTPTAAPEVPRAPVLAWLPVELHPWSAKFSNLEPLAPIQRVSGACGIVGSLQAAGAFARDEARIVAAVQKWRALYMATGVLPTVEGGST